jgi:RsiW-degrading membrane proteinase PrsW (M82 family)
MVKNPFSIKGESVFNNDANLRADPSEKIKLKKDRASELETMRDSVFNEPLPNVDHKKHNFSLWLKEKTASTSFSHAVIATISAGILGALWSIICIFYNSLQGGQIITFAAFIYVIVVGPVVEELLKQSGNIYLLEQKPYLLKYKWQVFAIALISSLGFAAIENILYTKLYVKPSEIKDFAAFVDFRWTVCVCLHCCCSLIASLGLANTREKMLKQGKPAELSIAFPFFTVAIIIHGLYNGLAVFVLNKIFE